MFYFVLSLQHIIKSLDKSCEEHTTFQTCQKQFDQWLLQTSLRLMSHNTLDVSTMELAEQHVQVHQVSTIIFPSCVHDTIMFCDLQTCENYVSMQ